MCLGSAREIANSAIFVLPGEATALRDVSDQYAYGCSS